ncbi:DUF4148 domain-containing protein [Noviherbaspirillum sp. Root189]|uniref:DUF4148 domain-containing protein n=1 Tax=Noviherbaspirillum sp. Root189 TaxID=1736487 RepID=UPI000710344A|nr:DUF4148 domain-containing protein [Noviherbaspirillum sp. Root189]KRB91419.1 hypothetical protein ASE07_16295 [Noviherbaspirillum sp. Root189]
MNAKKLIAALAVFAAAGTSFAADATYPYVDHSQFQSTRTRAEVMAELKDSQANGNYIVGGQEFAAPDTKFVSTKTRAQVMAELRQAQEDGSYALAQQEFEGQYPALQNRNANTRLANTGKAPNLN